MTHPTIDQLEMLSLFHREKIPDGYLDLMGHMNIQFYVKLFDAAAWELLRQLGMTEAYAREQQNGMFALRQVIDYVAEVHVGETVAVRSRVNGRSAKRLHFTHFMINETTGKLAATMEVLSSHADLTIRRTSPFPPELATHIDALLAEQQQLPWQPHFSGAIHPQTV